MATTICHQCHYLSVHSPHPGLGGILNELDPGPGLRLHVAPGDASGGVGLGRADQLQSQLGVVREIELVHCDTRSIWNVCMSAQKKFFMTQVFINL